MYFMKIIQERERDAKNNVCKEKNNNDEDRQGVCTNKVDCS